MPVYLKTFSTSVHLHALEAHQVTTPVRRAHFHFPFISLSTSSSNFLPIPPAIPIRFLVSLSVTSSFPFPRFRSRLSSFSDIVVAVAASSLFLGGAIPRLTTGSNARQPGAVPGQQQCIYIYEGSRTKTLRLITFWLRGGGTQSCAAVVV